MSTTLLFGKCSGCHNKSDKIPATKHPYFPVILAALQQYFRNTICNSIEYKIEERDTFLKFK